jgi:hypothetical protein
MVYSLVLIFHVWAASVGLLSGAAAMIFRKGSPRHGLAGNVFVVSMLAMGVSASCLGLMINDPGDVGVGVMTCYFVATGWATARRRNGGTSLFDWLGLLAIFAFAAASLTTAFQVVNGQARLEDGVPVGMLFFLGSLATLAAAGDLRMLVRAGSFFFGQAHIFSPFVRKTYILALLGILPLMLLVFWLLRVGFGNAWAKRKAGPASCEGAVAEPPPSVPPTLRGPRFSSDGGGL